MSYIGEVRRGYTDRCVGAAIIYLNLPVRLNNSATGKDHVSHIANTLIVFPREYYERIGDLPNLVFSCGAVIEPDNEVKLYYGASNSCIAVGTTTVERIVEACMDEVDTQ
ncbi:unnamed protein product [marine sediment metagenome]|uniref:Glycosidase n=1 Tax=marine sediment metagenome TaxID=412755 RepID=X0Z3K4_9ZZZZ